MMTLRKSIQLFTLSAGLLIMGTPVFAQSTWKIDPAHSSVSFSTVHNTIADVGGLFNVYESTVTASKADFSDGVFDLTIDVASIDTQVEMRDNHLRSADFFDVEKFPTMTFKSTSVEKADVKDHYKLNGELTMHGVTKTVTLKLWHRGTITDAQSGNEISGFQISGIVNRLDFGLGQKFPAALISNEVMVKADGEFIKQK